MRTNDFVQQRRKERASVKRKGDSAWESAYRVVLAIPRGRVTTYGEIARAVRLPGGARAAGYAMAACPSGRGIPWHRVVGAGGYLRIPEPHGSLQRKLLESEGVKIERDRTDLSRFGWPPTAAKGTQRDKRRKARRKGRLQNLLPR